MSGLRYYLDENVIHGPLVAEEVRKRGFNAVAALEVRPRRTGDLRSGASRLRHLHGRVMVTQDAHFRPSVPHGGLIVMQRPLSLGDYILYLEILAEQFDPGGLDDQVHYWQL